MKSLARTMPHEVFGTWNICERILKQHWGGRPAGSQYLTVWLHKGKGEQHIFRVHRLVAEHFIPKIDGKNFVNHIDCDRENNRADNLEWTTPLENTRHALINGRMERGYQKRRKAVINLDTGDKYNSIAEAEEQLIGKKTGAISHCLCGKSKMALGNHWRYV